MLAAGMAEADGDGNDYNAALVRPGLLLPAGGIPRSLARMPNKLSPATQLLVLRHFVKGSRLGLCGEDWAWLIRIWKGMHLCSPEVRAYEVQEMCRWCRCDLVTNNVEPAFPSWSLLLACEMF